MKGDGPDSCAVLTTTTSGHPLSSATGAMEDHPTSIKYQDTKRFFIITLYSRKHFVSGNMQILAFALHAIVEMSKHINIGVCKKILISVD